MTTIHWGARQRGNLISLTDHERDHGPVIPAASPILVWEKVSWWRPWNAKPPRTEIWPLANPGQVASFHLEAGSEAEGAFARWSQPGGRTY